jgi:hypothetical protein
MSAPDKLIHEILKRTKTPTGELSPLDATAELAAIYEMPWVDKNKCAAADIESYKRRFAFKPNSESAQLDFYSIVVLGEGKERVWVFRGEMRRHHMLMRIQLISKKDKEHHEAAEAEIKYWHDTLKAQGQGSLF